MTKTTNGEHTCRRLLYRGSFTGYPCGKPANVERDGRWYCKRHDPVAVQAKRDAKMAKFRYELEAVQRERLEAARRLADVKRRAAAFDGVRDALRALCAALPNEVADLPGADAELFAARVALAEVADIPPREAPGEPAPDAGTATADLP